MDAADQEMDHIPDGMRAKKSDIDTPNGINPKNAIDQNPKAVGIRAIFNYPLGAYFCLGNEFTEVFSGFGMQSLLVIYLINVHGLSASGAKLLFHSFSFANSFIPILGAILADGFLGRYRVILIGSVAYCVGHLCMTTGAIPSLGVGFMKALDYVGLCIIACAAGCIKPCITAFSADQFPPNREAERTQFFSFFYLMVNLGAFTAGIITPIIRRQPCMGHDTCYPLAFGIPAIFMFIATAIFLSGTRFYTIVKVRDNAVGRVGKCIFHALKMKFRDNEKKKHWLDYASPKFDHALISDVKAFIDIVVLFSPMIILWALYSLIGSSWVLQANRMNGRIGNLTILPDQMNAINPILIITLIPLFEILIYPTLAKCDILTRPLRRIGWGELLVVVSFIVGGMVQLAIDKTEIEMPIQGHARLSIVNFMGCDANFNTSHQNFIAPANSTSTRDVENFSLMVDQSINCNRFSKANITLPVMSNAYFIILSNDPHSDAKALPYELAKTMDGKTRIYVIFEPRLNSNVNVSITIEQEKNVKGTVAYADHLEEIPKLDVQPSLYGSNKYDIFLERCYEKSNCSKNFLLSFAATTGAAHVLVVPRENGGSRMDEIIPANSVSILWQVPQYVIITVGEILFSITSLSFSYSQASPRMKAVFLAVFNLIMAFGNLLDAGISGTGLFEHKPALEFFIFGGVMGIVLIFFVILAKRYKDKSSVYAK